MATIQTQRDATVILTDSSNWIPWYRQLKLKCQSQGIWPLLDPEGVRLQRIQPEAPLPPDISQYEPSSSPSAASSHTTRNARGNTRGSAQDTTEMSTTTSRIPTIPTRVSELSEKGQEAYKEDRDDYKLRLESYKIRERDYQEESNKISKIVEHILTTVTPHLQLSCCTENGTPRDWITALQDTVGVDEDEERARARERYQAALKPMRSTTNWETWLNEYDQAATRAETLEVAEVMQTQAVIDDFLGSVSKMASTWTAGFQGPGYDKKAMNRKRMMKLFREYMSLHYPSRGKPKSAFAVGDSYAASGEPDSDTLRDASSVELRAPSNQGRGNPRQSNKRKMDGQSTRTKQIPERNSAKAGDICPACEQRHKLSDCYYVNKAKAPEWFKPNQGIARLVQYKLENDTNLQRTMQEMSPETKRPRFSTTSRSITPHIKTSQTPDAVIE
ncbi:hypothetical protein PTNB73_10578 [Pyrenophora teres f. teres]|nr:hypothetical protein PTNB73_10578 [Pyrenophora teres f. teres]